MSWTMAMLAVAVGVGVFALVRARAAGPAKPAASRAQPGDAIDAFWTWWLEAGPRLAAKIDEGKAVEIEAELSGHVHSIDGRLAWETGKGLRGARHHLALSAEGDIQLRVLTERWVSRAPRPDTAWEYYPARQAWQSVGIRLHDPDFDLDVDAMRIAAELVPEREIIDVRIYSPVFAKIPEEARLRGAYLLLDNLLGEDAVEKWLGRVDTFTVPLEAGEPFTALREHVAQLARTATGDRWALLKEKDPAGAPTFHMVNLALKRVDHLLMEQLLEVTFPLRAPTKQGLTTDAEADRLNVLEDALLAALGRDAVQIGHQTGHGRRTVHFHAAALGPAEQRAREWAQGVKDYTVEVRSRPDPAWEILKRF